MPTLSGSAFCRGEAPQTYNGATFGRAFLQYHHYNCLGILVAPVFRNSIGDTSILLASCSLLASCNCDNLAGYGSIVCIQDPLRASV